MELISFQIKGRFAHFLRAESSVNALSYPVPPRTVIIGILGAVLGLPKDKPQILLEPANIAISGKLPKTHWHRVKLRKDPPTSLPHIIKKTQKPTKNKAPEKAALILQEWLFEPDYTIWSSIPEPYQTELKNRFKTKEWHFTPFLGLSEMMADISYHDTNECVHLPKGTYDIKSAFQQKAVALEMDQIFERELVIHSLHMPRTLTSDRVFSHSAYFLERDGRAIPVTTEKAYKVNDKIVMFL